MNSHKVREVVHAMRELMKAEDAQQTATRKPEIHSEAVIRHGHNVTNKLAELIADEVHAILTERQHRVPPYDPFYGDDKPCICGHPYYRHFDTYDDMAPVGCKYCLHEEMGVTYEAVMERKVCSGFKEAT